MLHFSAAVVTTKAMPKATILRPKLRRRLRSRSEIVGLKKHRTQWLASLASEAPFLELFDYIPGISFFAKDREGRTMFASHRILERYQMQAETEMLGLTDFEINPDPMAESYVRDDELLLKGAAKRVERIELWFDRLGLPDWFLVTKLPLLDKQGRPHGVMGILRRVGGQEMKLPFFKPSPKRSPSSARLCQASHHRRGRRRLRGVGATASSGGSMRPLASPPGNSSSAPASLQPHVCLKSPISQSAKSPPGPVLWTPAASPSSSRSVAG